MAIWNLERQLKLLSRFAKNLEMERKKLWEGKEGSPHQRCAQLPHDAAAMDVRYVTLRTSITVRNHVDIITSRSCTAHQCFRSLQCGVIMLMIGQRSLQPFHFTK